MASRKFSRRNGGGSKIPMILGALVLLGAGLGGYVYFSGDEGQGAAVLADVVPDVSSILQGKEDKKEAAPDSGAVTLVQLAGTIAAAESATRLEGHARDAGLNEGYGKLKSMLEGPMPPAEREQAITVFHKITDELFLSPIHNAFSENYIVKSGDSLAVIAHRAGISLNLLYDLNKKPRGTKEIHPGDNLKLPKGRPSVVVRKTDYTASLYFGDNMVRQYVIAHGKGDNTPEGETTITSKVVDPEKGSRGPNDPVNEMRVRWIGLDRWADARNGNVRNGIGFHGTIYPDSIGKMESLGCIRMRDADVIELYDIVREGNKVEIRA